MNKLQTIDEFFLDIEEPSQTIDEFFSDVTGISAPTNYQQQPSQLEDTTIGKPQEESTFDAVKRIGRAGLTGLADGITTEIPSLEPTTKLEQFSRQLIPEAERAGAALAGTIREFGLGASLGYADLYKVFPELGELERKFQQNIPIKENDPFFLKMEKAIRNDPAILAKLPARMLGFILPLAGINKAVSAVLGVPKTVLSAIGQSALTGSILGGTTKPNVEDQLSLDAVGARAKNALTTAATFAVFTGAANIIKTTVNSFKLKKIDVLKEELYSKVLDGQGLERSDINKLHVDNMVTELTNQEGGLKNLSIRKIIRAINRVKNRTISTVVEEPAHALGQIEEPPIDVKGEFVRSPAPVTPAPKSGEGIITQPVQPEIFPQVGAQSISATMFGSQPQLQEPLPGASSKDLLLEKKEPGQTIDEFFSDVDQGALNVTKEAADVLAPIAEEDAAREDQERQRLQRLGLRLPEEAPSAAESAEVFEQEEKKPPPEGLTTKESVDKAAQESATSPENDLPQPTEAQKEAGNYKKGKVTIQGMDISIENPKGSIRSGVDSDGETWETTMQSHYGYIKGTVGKDKDHLDVFIGENPESNTVFVVDQVNPKTGEFDEHKVMLGYNNMRAARKGYRENYQKGWKGLGAITKMPIGAFREWSQNKDETQKPLKYTVPTATLKPPSVKGALDSVSPNTNLFGDLVVVEPGLKKGYSKLNVPRKRVVMTAMLTSFHDPQVFRSVVESIPVDMMNDLIGKKVSTEEILRNPSMFIDNLVANADSGVAARVFDVAMGLPAPRGTKVDFLGHRRGAIKRGAALSADDIVSKGSLKDAVAFATAKSLGPLPGGRLVGFEGFPTNFTKFVHELYNTGNAALSQQKTEGQVPKEEKDVSDKVRSDTGQRVRKEERKLEKKEQPSVAPISEEEALRQRPGEGGEDIQLTEESGREASEWKKRLGEEVQKYDNVNDFINDFGSEKSFKKFLRRKARELTGVPSTDQGGTFSKAYEDFREYFEPLRIAVAFDKSLPMKYQALVGPVGKVNPLMAKKLEEFYNKIKTEKTDKGVKMYSVEGYTPEGKRLKESIPRIPTPEPEKPSPPRTLDLVKAVFPGQDIEETKDGFEVTLKNGLKIQVSPVEEIVAEGADAPKLGEGEYIAGVYISYPNSDKTEQIKLSTKAGVTTLHHESVHFLEDFGIITKEEAGKINRHIKKSGKWNKDKSAEENRAEWLADELNKPGPKTTIGRIWAKIKEFISRLINKLGIRTVGGIKQDIKSGEIFERPAKGTGQAKEQYSVERKGVPTEESVEHPGMLQGQVDELIYFFQDKFNYLNKAQMDVERTNRSELPESQNAYMAETRFSGMAAAAIQDFEGEFVDPILDIVGENDIDIDALDEYLYARHAKEANARLKRINPDRADNDALSGMTDAEADKIINDVATSPKAEVFQSLGNMVDKITKVHRDILRSSGLESKETIDQWESTYENYVPLMREGKSEKRMPVKGRGFDVRGKQKIRAGSTRSAINILANTVANTEAAIIRAEKVKVARTFLEFAQNNPGPWKIDTVEYKPRFNADGLIEYRPDPLFRDADNVFVVPVAEEYILKPEKRSENDKLIEEIEFGEVLSDAEYKKMFGEKRQKIVNHRIIFDESNFNAMRIASAMKNLDAQSQGIIVGALSRVSRYLSMVHTSLSPEFILSNFIRDLQTAGYNLSDSEADNVKLKIFKDIKSSWRGIREFQKGDKTTEWAKWYDQFRKAGGQVGWVENYRSIADRQNKMINRIKKMHAGKNISVRKGLHSILQFIEDENTAVENAIRLSIFKNLIENGATEAKAAVIAKESTVNFNRKGAMGSTMNALYLFSNASIQGTARIIKAAKNSPKVRKMMMATVLFATILDIVNRAIGGKDDDGEDRYDKIAPWVKESKLIIMLPDNNGYVQLPLPWGYNIFHVIGQVAGEAITKDGFDAIDGATRVAGSAIRAFNPIGGEASLLQLISPTIIDPVVQWAENKDWTGRKIRPDTNVFDPKPQSQIYWNSVREPSRIIAQEINALTGGDEIKPGKIDISPEMIDMVVDATTGSAGKFVGNLVSTPIKAIKGQEIETFEVPFLRRVYGKFGNQALSMEYYENMDAVDLVYRQLLHYKKDRKKIEEIKKESRQEVKSIKRMQMSKKDMKTLKDGKKDAEKITDKAKRQRKLKEIDAKIKQTMRAFNRFYKKQRKENSK